MGFTQKSQGFLLWFGYLVWPALGIVLASLLHRAKVDGVGGLAGLLEESDPVNSLSKVLTAATKDPANWFASGGIYLCLIVGLALFITVVIVAYDWFLARALCR